MDKLMTLVLFCLALSFGRAEQSRWHHYPEESEATASLTAKSNPGGSSSEPSFVSRIENQTVSVGRDVILGCQVKNLGHNYKVGWLKVSDQTILTLHKRVITHNSRIRVTHDEQRTWNLLIRNVQAEDDGCYMCQINTAIMKKELGCIKVLVPPDIQLEKTSSDITVNENEDATLVCHATGKPQPTIIWKREDGKPFHVKGHKKMVSDFFGEFLVLHRVKRKDMGAFMCIAKNDVPPTVSKRIELKVNFPPNVSVDNQLIGSPIGETVVLRCMVEAYPTAITYWVRNGPNGREEMLLNRPKYTIEEQKFTYKVELSMTIDEFTEDDVGVYTCTSTNSLGIKESTVRVYKMARRTTLQMNLNANSSPSPQVVWTTSQNSLPNAKTSQGGPKGDMKNKLYYNSNLKDQDHKRLSNVFESTNQACSLPVYSSMMLLFLLFTMISC